MKHEDNEHRRTTGGMGSTNGVGVKSGLSSQKQISSTHGALGGSTGEGDRPDGSIGKRSGTHNGRKWTTY